MKKTSRRRPARSASRTNRRRRSLPALLLPWALLALAAEVAAALLISPRFQVHRIALNGNRIAPGPDLVKRLRLPARQPLALSRPAGLEKRLLADPRIARARVSLAFPDTLQVEVTERQAAFCACVAGTWWECDAGGVAFRRVGGPSATLPQVEVKDRAVPRAGEALAPDRMEALNACLAWSRAHPEFRLASLSLEKGGKLCLNSDGGMPVRLGSAVELPQKLETLSKLVARYPEIRAGYDIAYVNLVAWDAPAVLPRHAPDGPPEPLL